MDKQKQKHKTQAAPVVIQFDERLRYTISEAAALLKISRSRLFLQLAAGEVASFTEGKRRFIPGTEIVRRSGIAICGGSAGQVAPTGAAATL